jgi:glycosyltransferase involved in cell wall biosynthesis
VELWRATSDPDLADVPGPTQASLDWVRHPDGHPSDRYFSELGLAELTAATQEFRPDVTVLDQIWLRRYLPALAASGRPVVLNTQNVEALLHSGMSARREVDGAPPLLLRLLPERTAALEAAAVSAVDQVWVCSDSDSRVMRETYEDCAEIVVVPNTIDVESYGGVPVGRNGFSLIYPGQFMYPPNSEAALFLAREVLPPLRREFPDMKLVLMGRGPTPAMLEVANGDDSLEVTGAVPDARPYLAAASAMPVPLFEGGGTRFKVLEAFASRVPVVSTEKGVEGLGLRPGEHYLRAESGPEFVEQLRALRLDTERAGELAARAHQLVSERYSWDAAARTVGDALERLVGR